MYFILILIVGNLWTIPGEDYDGHNFAMNPLYFNSAALLFD